MKRKVFYKIIKLFILLLLILVLIAPRSYGWCNTVSFKKTISAIKLTLSDGQVMYNMVVNKDRTSNTNVRLAKENYKELNLTYVNSYTKNKSFYYVRVYRFN